MPKICSKTPVSYLVQLRLEIPQIELPFSQLLLEAYGLLLVELPWAFSIRVRTSPIPRICEAIRSGSKGIQGLDFFTDPENLIGFSVTALMESVVPPLGISLHLRKDHPAKIQCVVEALADIDGVLSGHGICHQKDLAGPDGCLDPFQFGHESLIYMKPTRGIYDQHIDPFLPLKGHLGRWPPGRPLNRWDAQGC